eukprot:384740-Hanusia_phi.AAC.2
MASGPPNPYRIHGPSAPHPTHKIRLESLSDGGGGKGGVGKGEGRWSAKAQRSRIARVVNFSIGGVEQGSSPCGFPPTMPVSSLRLLLAPHSAALPPAEIQCSPPTAGA